MKKIIFLLLLPAAAFADRLGSLRSSADVLLTTQAVSGGASSMETMVNGVRLSSPTISQNFVGAGVSGAMVGSTATITITGGGDNLGNHISTKSITANYGIATTTITVSTITSTANPGLTITEYDDGAIYPGLRIMLPPTVANARVFDLSALDLTVGDIDSSGYSTSFKYSLGGSSIPFQLEGSQLAIANNNSLRYSKTIYAGASAGYVLDLSTTPDTPGVLSIRGGDVAPADGRGTAGIRLYDYDKDKYVQLQSSPSITTSYNVYLPTAPGTLAQYINVLKVDGTDVSTNWDTLTLDDVNNPEADKTFTMANKQVKFTYAAPAVADGAFEIDITGGFSGDGLHVHQHDGNPGASHLVHFESEDVDVLPLSVEGAGPVTAEISGPGVVRISSNTILPGATFYADGNHKITSTLRVSTLKLQQATIQDTDNVLQIQISSTTGADPVDSMAKFYNKSDNDRYLQLIRASNSTRSPYLSLYSGTVNKFVNLRASHTVTNTYELVLPPDVGTAGQVVSIDTVNGSTVSLAFSDNIGTIGVSLDGGGSALSAGGTWYVPVPYDGSIVSWTLTADTTGSMVIDVKKCAGFSCDPTTSIAGTEKPTLSSVWANEDPTLSSWTTTVTAGDKFGFVLDSASTVTKATLVIKVNKT